MTYPKGYSLISSDIKFEGEILKLRVDRIKDVQGQVIEREVIEHGGGVGIIALLNDERIVLVKQYRHGAKAELFEIPAGLIEQGEEPKETARRELFEETGLIATDLTQVLSFYFAPGNSTERVHLFLAEGTKGELGQLDRSEISEVLAVDLSEAMKMADLGQIVDSKTLLALFFLFYRQKG